MFRPIKNPISLAFYITGFSAFIGLYLPQPLLPLLADEFGVSAQNAGLIISMSIFGIALSSPFIGVLSDRFGRKKILVTSASTLAILMIGCTLSNSFQMLLLFRFLQGLCLPGLFVVAVAFTSERLSKEAMTSVAGVYVACTVIGGLLGRLTGGALADLFSWRYGFIVSSFFYALVALTWLRQKDPSPTQVNKTLRDSLKGTLSHFQNRLLVGGLAVGFCLFFAFQATFNYLPFKLEEAPFSLNSTLISLTYLAFIAGMISSSFSGWFRKAFKLKGSFIIGFILAAVGNLMTLAGSLNFILLGLVIICFGNWLVQGLAVGYVATATKHDRAGANALYLLFYYLGGSLGGYLPGLSFANFGYVSVVSLSVIALAIGLLCTLFLIQESN